MTQVQDKSKTLQVEESQSSELLPADDFVAKAVEKVQLDIDDAPFLNEDELPEESSPTDAIPSPRASSRKEEEPEEPPKKSKKKLIIIILIPVLLIIIGIVVYFLFLRPEPPSEPITVLVEPSQTAIVPKDFQITLDPFWTPFQKEDGSSVFLLSSFVLSTSEQKVSEEITAKMTTIRDAIYYYLISADPAYLLNSENAALIKSDMLDAINSYIVQGEVASVFFDSYITK